MPYKATLIRLSLVAAAVLAAASDRVLAAVPPAPPNYYNDAVKAFQQQDYRTALQLARNSEATAPDAATYHALVIQSMVAIGDYDAAAAHVRAAAVSGLPITWQTLYQFYGDHVKTFTDQLKALTTFAGDHPMDADAHLLLGYEYLVVRKRELAHEQFARVIKLSPFDDFAAKLDRETKD